MPKRTPGRQTADDLKSPEVDLHQTVRMPHRYKNPKKTKYFPLVFASPFAKIESKKSRRESLG